MHRVMGKPTSKVGRFEFSASNTNFWLDIFGSTGAKWTVNIYVMIYFQRLTCADIIMCNCCDGQTCCACCPENFCNVSRSSLQQRTIPCTLRHYGDKKPNIVHQFKKKASHIFVTVTTTSVEELRTKPNNNEETTVFIRPMSTGTQRWLTMWKWTLSLARFFFKGVYLQQLLRWRSILIALVAPWTWFARLFQQHAIFE